MRKPEYKPTVIVELRGTDGNAFAIMGRVKRALRTAGADEEYVNRYLQESMKGDYHNLLKIAKEYANLEH